MNLQKVFTAETQRLQSSECFYEKFFLRVFHSCGIVWQYGDLIDVMLGKAKHLGFFTTFRTSLRLRLRMRLRKSLSAVSNPNFLSLLPAPCSMLHARCSLLPAPCSAIRNSLSSMLHAPCSLLRAPCSLLFTGVLFTLLSTAPAPAQVRQEQAKLTNVVGQVEVLRRGTTAWQPAKVGMPLSAGDEIRAAQDSGAEIAMTDGSIVMVFARSRLQIRQLTTETATQSRTSMFHLVVGLVRYIVSQPAVTLVRARQNQFTISTPTAVMAARGTDGVLGYAAAAGAAAPAVKPGVAKPGVPAPGAAPAGGQTTLLCLGGISALAVLPVVPGTVATGEQIFCENGQIWQVESGRMNLLLVLPNSIRAAVEAGASPQDVKQVVESATPVPFTWTPVEQAIYDASPFDLPQGPTLTEVTQIANTALTASMPPTTIATALPVRAAVQVQSFEQLVSGTATAGSDVQRQQAAEISPFAPSQQSLAPDLRRR